jgi:hypothetical protein
VRSPQHQENTGNLMFICRKSTQLPFKMTYFVNIAWANLQKTKEHGSISGENARRQSDHTRSTQEFTSGKAKSCG